MRVIVTAGGTGGHIYPALAIINKIKEKEPQSEFLYIGTTDRMEAEVVPQYHVPYVGIKMLGLNRKHPWKNFRVLKVYLEAVKKAKQEIQKFAPDIVIGVGGYISAPVVYAASKLGYKTMIHEQNSISGVSNKFLSHYVDKILVSFKETMALFPKDKVVYTGNPRSEEIASLAKSSKQSLGFSEKKPLVLIVMGSLGSMTMTKKLRALVPAFKDKPYEVLLVTGKDYLQDYETVSCPSNVKIVATYTMPQLKVADLIVMRSGASTIAEVEALALPSIMVPSPYVTHNHQMKNALALEKEGACKILSEEEFDKERLISLIDEILQDKYLLLSMQKALKKRAVLDSASRIYAEAKKLVRDE